MYVKLFSDILLSSLWAEDNNVRIIWITLLLLADEDGMVRSTAAGIAHTARIDPEKTKQALITLERPDPDSRTPDNEGKRIERVEGGYMVLNYLRYREMTDRERQRAQSRARVKAYRERLKVKQIPASNDVTHNVTLGNALLLQAEADAEAKAEAKNNDSCSEPAKKPPVTEPTIPAELKELSLYAKDKKLIQAWPELKVALEKANPGVVVAMEVAKAHAWEVANPTRRKRDRPRFLTSWMARAQDRQPARESTIDNPEAMKRQTMEALKDYDDTGKKIR